MPKTRIGLGYDSHRFADGRKLILGGVEIAYEKGLAGHSDADVLTHAVIDALLGAAHLGNIGLLFPDTDAAYLGANSLQLLKDVVRRVRKIGWRVVNLDAVLITEAPRINPHVAKIEATLAEALQVDPADVSVKPKTNEKLGFEGRGDIGSSNRFARKDSGMIDNKKHFRKRLTELKALSDQALLDLYGKEHTDTDDKAIKHILAERGVALPESQGTVTEDESATRIIEISELAGAKTEEPKKMGLTWMEGVPMVTGILVIYLLYSYSFWLSVIGGLLTAGALFWLFRFVRRHWRRLGVKDIYAKDL